MSAHTQSDLEMASVTTVRGFLQGFLDEALAVDASLHQAIEHLRVRIYALGLADDPEFQAEHREFSEQLTAGKVEDDGLTAEEFASRYLVP